MPTYRNPEPLSPSLSRHGGDATSTSPSNSSPSPLSKAPGPQYPPYEYHKQDHINSPESPASSPGYHSAPHRQPALYSPSDTTPSAYYDRERAYSTGAAASDYYPSDVEREERWREAGPSYSTSFRTFANSVDIREYSRERDRDRPSHYGSSPPAQSPILPTNNYSPGSSSKYGGGGEEQDHSYPSHTYTSASSSYYTQSDHPTRDPYYPRPIVPPSSLPHIPSASAHVPTSHERGSGGLNIKTSGNGSGPPIGYGPFSREPPDSPSVSVAPLPISRPMNLAYSSSPSSGHPRGVPSLPHLTIPGPVRPPDMKLIDDLRSLNGLADASSAYGHGNGSSSRSPPPPLLDGNGNGNVPLSSAKQRRGGTRMELDIGVGVGSERKGMKKTENACYFCRRRKLKCDGGRPCTNCNRRGTDCQYDEIVKRRGPGKKNKKSSTSGSGSANGEGDHDGMPTSPKRRKTVMGIPPPGIGEDLSGQFMANGPGIPVMPDGSVLLDPGPGEYGSDQRAPIASGIEPSSLPDMRRTHLPLVHHNQHQHQHHSAAGIHYSSDPRHGGLGFGPPPSMMSTTTQYSPYYNQRSVVAPHPHPHLHSHTHPNDSSIRSLSPSGGGGCGMEEWVKDTVDERFEGESPGSGSPT